MLKMRYFYIILHHQMNTSPKNLLQQFYQKYKLPIPLYFTSKIGGEEHTPIFISNITLHTGKSFKSDPCPSKKDAEMNLASKCLDYIQTLSIRKQVICTTHPLSIFILIDAENVPFQRLLDNYTFDNSIIPILFLSKYHHLSEKSFPYNIQLIDSSRKDACDIAISLYTYTLLRQTCVPDHIIVVTKDHFASTLSDLIQSKYLLQNNLTTTYYHSNSIEDCIKYIMQLS